MRISNSKKQLARIISENGGWREWAEWAAQDKYHCGFENVICFYRNDTPWFNGGDFWRGNGVHEDKVRASELVKNWHQTILSRDEYFHLYPAPDADGWIEWKGGECPVEKGTLIDVRYRDGHEQVGCECGVWRSELYGTHYWLNSGGNSNIIAYRLHKPSEINNLTQVGDTDVVESKQTIEQLAAEYKDRLEIAKRAQEEADFLREEAESALSRLEIAGLVIGLDIAIAVDDAEHEDEPGMVIADWRQWRVGDYISWSIIPTTAEYKIISVHHDEHREIGDFEIMDGHGCVFRCYGDECKFIRRP